MNTLLKQKVNFKNATSQVSFLEETSNVKFHDKLKLHKLFPLRPTNTEILQVNLGKLCNQTCDHCHVDAGPDRREIMSKEDLQSCLNVARSPSIHTVDLTGGAPEMNPNFRWFVAELARLDKKIIVRSNLTILTYKDYSDLPLFFKKHEVAVVSSLPCYTEENVDKQRGNGVFNRSIQALKKLNKLGYGMAGTGLELHLVFNPGGPSLPPDQKQLEQDYKRELNALFGIEFNQLFTITNLPINRFLDHLINEERYDEYMNKLIDSFNPAAAQNVMCRNTLSVGWDGRLFDCDFNQMLDLEVGSCANRIGNYSQEELMKRNIVLGQHCFGCTAGTGSSCQGSLL